MPVPLVMAEVNPELIQAVKEIVKREVNRDKWWWRVIGITVSLATIATAIFEFLSYRLR